MENRIQLPTHLQSILKCSSVIEEKFWMLPESRYSALDEVLSTFAGQALAELLLSENLDGATTLEIAQIIEDGIEAADPGIVTGLLEDIAFKLASGEARPSQVEEILLQPACDYLMRFVVEATEFSCTLKSKL
jgi:hypothetical protein